MSEISLPEAEKMLRDAWGEEACIEVFDHGSEVDLFASKSPNLRPRFIAVGYPLDYALGRLVYILRETVEFKGWQDEPRQEGDLEAIRQDTLEQRMYLDGLYSLGDAGAA